MVSKVSNLVLLTLFILSNCGNIGSDAISVGIDVKIGEPESVAEPEPVAEPESVAEPEPAAEPELSTESESSEELKEKDTKDKCDCKVSDILVSMTEVIKGLSEEMTAMKKMMVKTCPGFNETSYDTEEDAETSEEPTVDNDMDNETDESDIPISCNTPFQLVASSCYYFMYSTSDWKSWGQANAYCQTLGGTLATPNNLKELRVYLKLHFSYTTAIPKLGSSAYCAGSFPHLNGVRQNIIEVERYQSVANVFWVGAMKEDDSEDYLWLNGNMVNPEDFKDGHPSTPGDKTCIYLESVSDYKAVNFYCGEKFSFVCEQRDSDDE